MLKIKVESNKINNFKCEIDAEVETKETNFGESLLAIGYIYNTILQNDKKYNTPKKITKALNKYINDILEFINLQEKEEVEDE